MDVGHPEDPHGRVVGYGEFGNSGSDRISTGNQSAFPVKVNSASANDSHSR